MSLFKNILIFFKNILIFFQKDRDVSEISGEYEGWHNCSG